MKFKIEHEIKGRIRIHACQKKMTCREADILQYYLNIQEAVDSAKVNERTGNAVITYSCDRDTIVDILKKFSYENAGVPEEMLKISGREMNRKYQEKLVNTVLLRAGVKLFCPAPVKAVASAVKSVKYIVNGVLTGKEI